MNNRIYNYLRNRSIYSRVHRFNLIIAITSLILITISSIAIYTNISMVHLSENEGQSLYYYSKNIESKLYQIDSEIIKITQLEDNQEFLSNYLVYDELERYLAINTISEQVSQALSMSDSVTDVFLFTNNYVPIRVFSGSQSDFTIDKFDYVSLLKKTVSQSNNTILADGSNFSISNSPTGGLLYAKRITDIDNTTINTGYIVLYISKSSLFDFNSGLSPRIQDHAQHHVINKNGAMIFSSNESLSGADLNPLAERIKEEISKENNYFFAGQKYKYIKTSMCAFANIDVLDSYVITAIPYSFFASELLIIAGLLFLFMIVLSIVSTVMSRHISRSIVVPINSLLSSLKAISSSDFSLAPADMHQDELADLRNLLNDTTQRIADLLVQVKSAERQKFTLQFKALQAQINPHFLINTLNTVIWLADLQGADNIKQITSSLILILNNILRNESKLISLKEELEMLKKYITVQKFKYFDRFNVNINAEKELMQYNILKFILQPLVENCLMHGMSESTVFLDIEINVYKEGNNLFIVVSDNGAGMTKQRIKEVMEEDKADSEKDSKHPSIGLSNINSRISLFYGERYHLTINSDVGHGTSVTIMLPLIQKEESE